MKIVIFSDSHDNKPNIEKFLAWVNKNNIKEVIFCGDLCAPAILKNIIAPNYQGRLYMVFGNVTDREVLSKVAKEYSNIVHYGDEGEVIIDKIKIGFIHYPDKARQMAASGQFDYVFYGHSHKPWEEDINGCKLVNPGTLGGLFYRATFAVLDTRSKKLDLKLIERL